MKLKLFKLATGLLAFGAALALLPLPIAAANPVALVIGGSGATPWIITNIIPGNSGTQPITISNSGSGPGTLTIWISNIVNTEGTPAEFEPNPGATGELGGYLNFALVSARTISNIPMPALITRFPQSSIDSSYIKVLSLAAGETVYLNWNWNLPLSAGNIVQGDTLRFDINYMLEQIGPQPTTTIPPSTTITNPPTITTPAPTTSTPPATSTVPPQTSTTPPASSSTPPPQTTPVPPSTTFTAVPTTPVPTIPNTLPATQPPATTKEPTTVPATITTSTTTAPQSGPISGETGENIIILVLGIELSVSLITISYFLAGRTRRK